MTFTKFMAAAACATIVASAASAQVNLTAETAGAGGVPHFSITHLAQVASEAGVADLQVLEGQTLTNSLRNVAEGNTDIAAVPLVLPFLLSRNLGPYAGLPEGRGAELVQNVRLLYPYNFSSHALWGFETAGITSYDQIEGLTILNGPPAGAALVSARQFITGLTGLEEGEGYNGLQVNWGQMGTAAMDGSADMNLLPIGFPDADVTAASSAGGVVIVSMPKDTFESEQFQRLANSPGRAPVVISEEEMGFGQNDNVRLVSEDGMFRGVVIAAGDVVRADMDEELVYTLVSEYITSMDVLKSRAKLLENTGIGVVDVAQSAVCGPNPVKYHAGAVRAWEDAGFTIADCAKP
ncbi:MAG: TAXI family TRAP transporter solute-binding subunit [Pseudomonadota bacterium]